MLEFFVSTTQLTQMSKSSNFVDLNQPCSAKTKILKIFIPLCPQGQNHWSMARLHLSLLLLCSVHTYTTCWWIENGVGGNRKETHKKHLMWTTSGDDHIDGVYKMIDNGLIYYNMYQITSTTPYPKHIDSVLLLLFYCVCISFFNGANVHTF